MPDERFAEYISIGEDFIAHHGVPNMEWYKHKFGEYQDHAKYAADRSRGVVKKKQIPITILSKNVEKRNLLRSNYAVTPRSQQRMALVLGL